MKGLFPGDRIPFTLKVHAALPEAERPLFYVRATSTREQAEVADLCKAAGKPFADVDDVTADKTAEVRVAEFADALAPVLLKTLAGWERLNDSDGEPIAFDAAGAKALVTDVMSVAGVQSLLTEAQDALHVGVESLGKSASPSPFSGGSFANGASAPTLATPTAPATTPAAASGAA